MVIKSLLLGIMCVSLAFCSKKPSNQSQNVKQLSIIEKGSYVADAANYVVLPVKKIAFLDSTLGTYKQAKLSAQDYVQIKSMLHQAVDRYNSGKQANEYRQKIYNEEYAKLGFYGLGRDSIKLVNYKRQYFCGIDAEGDKIVYINCFCEDSSNWRKNVVFVDDGGACFFQVEINLTQKVIYSLSINSIA